jgi:chaperonin cofactor prefoldin
MGVNETSSEDETGKYTVPGYPYGYRYTMWPPGWAGYAMPYGYLQAYPAAQTIEAELYLLESYRGQLEGEWEAISIEIEGIETRIEELKSLIEKGGAASDSTRLPFTPFWGPAFYGPASTPQQERQTLELRAEAIERQIEDIRKRLEELEGGD